MMLGNLKRKLNKENGAVQIVEAAFVFPIMFIILFFLIYMGNAHYVKAQVEAVVETRAIEGAGYCADPILQTLKETNKVPSLKSLKTEPYRYIFGGMNSIEDKIATSVESDINGKSTSLFKNMEPKLKTSKSNIAKFNNYVVYSTFSVEVNYQIKFPISFLGGEAPPILTLNSRAEIPVNDTAEFIRNTDMVIDLFHGTKIGQSISDVFGKINDFISSFASK
ncbi:MAG: TadE family protein [Acutalibacteraceae bacterium]|nr:TadE family protein [Acutalibacteraceae bacterium]